MSDILFARWEDIERGIRDAVESVLLDYSDPADPPTDWEARQAQETAERVVEVAMHHLDGYGPDDIARGDFA